MDVYHYIKNNMTLRIKEKFKTHKGVYKYVFQQCKKNYELMHDPSKPCLKCSLLVHITHACA
jgi:hypothetical protein